ncbi:(2Fe-2S)-binding protein [Desulfobulbus propionicus]
MEPDERTMARLKAGCICKGVKLIRLIEAVDNGAATVAEVQRVCGIGDGPCQGRRCGAKALELLPPHPEDEQDACRHGLG